jgi:ankyrin repeat protein
MYIYENFIKQLNNSLLNIEKPSKTQTVCEESYTAKKSLSTPINPKTGRNSLVTSKENKTNSERINKIIIFYKKIKQSSTEKNEIIKTLINKTIFSDEEIQGLSNYILGGDKIKQKFGIINFIYTNITDIDNKQNFINKIYLFCLYMDPNLFNIDEMLKYLIENYKDININIHGSLILYDFVYNNKIDIIKILSKHSTFDPNITDINKFYTLLNYKFTKRSPQTHHFTENDIETLKYLLNLPNINVNLRNENGLSVLHYAIMMYYENNDYHNDYLFIKNYLLTHSKINVNIEDNTGKTPLYYVIIQNNIQLVKLLLSHKDIKVNIKDNTGKSILDIALDIELKTKYSEIVELLKTNLLNNKN